MEVRSFGNSPVKVATAIPDLHYIAANVSGGMIPGWELSNELEVLLGRTVPCVYVRNARKIGGHKELIVGLEGNPEIPQGSKSVVVEELVNFARTTVTSVQANRDAGNIVTHAATILFYTNPKSIEELAANSVNMVYLFTLPEFLAAAEELGVFSPDLIRAYRDDFLRDPLGWQARRGLVPRKDGGTQ